MGHPPLLVTVIDDEADMRLYATTLLTREGITCQAITPGQVTTYDWSAVAVAVVDLRMHVPGVGDGLAMLSWLAAHHPHAARVAWSAWVGPALEATRESQGADIAADAVVSKGSFAGLLDAVTKAAGPP